MRPTTTLIHLHFLISIPKGAIMSAAKCSAPAKIGHFNSKRCDYETWACRALPWWATISIPKGAIMSMARCAISFSPVNFNSKRCDYEERW